MKNAIEYFYNLRPSEIKKNKNEYLFEYDGKHYSIKECNRSLEEIQELYALENELYYKNIYLHQIILNNNSELITVIDNKNYILMRLLVLENRKINLNDLLEFKNINTIRNYNFIMRNNWRKLWIDKIDYIEYQINENKQKFSLFNSSVDFIIGLVENGIQLLYNVEVENVCVSHIRVNQNTRVRELYDPLNIILDSYVRDISEYVKDSLPMNIEEYLNVFNINNNDLFFFFVRLLFFTKYFDLFDSFLKNEQKDYEDELNSILIKFNEYETFLKKNYLILNAKYILPEIEWLKKQAL